MRVCIEQVTFLIRGHDVIIQKGQSNTDTRFKNESYIKTKLFERTTSSCMVVKTWQTLFYSQVYLYAAANYL